MQNAAGLRLIIIEDDGSKPDIAKSKAEALIYGEKVVALLGASLTASTGAVATVTNAMQSTSLPRRNSRWARPM